MNPCYIRRTATTAWLRTTGRQQQPSLAATPQRQPSRAHVILLRTPCATRMQTLRLASLRVPSKAAGHIWQPGCITWGGTAEATRDVPSGDTPELCFAAQRTRSRAAGTRFSAGAWALCVRKLRSDSQLSRIGSRWRSRWHWRDATDASESRGMGGHNSDATAASTTAAGTPPAAVVERCPRSSRLRLQRRFSECDYSGGPARDHLDFFGTAGTAGTAAGPGQRCTTWRRQQHPSDKLPPGDG